MAKVVFFAGAIACLSLRAGADEAPADASASKALREVAAAQVEAAGEASVVRGEGEWLFFVPELRHLAAGEFWGEAAAKVSRATRPDWADPLPVIVDFNEQVKSAGATLVFVPVPPKAVIYPDQLAGGVLGLPAERPDEIHAKFLTLLREKGVEVVDLAPHFLAHREKASVAGDLLFCQTDTHWSPRGCELAAAAIHDKIAALLEPKAARKEFEVRERPITITGDLAQMLQGEKGQPEKLNASVVTDVSTGKPPADDRDSPVLLVGDSHLLVFHAGGDMHGTGSGVADHLAKLLGYPADVVGVRGSGASPSRISLFRRRDDLAGKKVVVWLLTSREYTESQGWRPVPVVKTPAAP